MGFISELFGYVLNFLYNIVNNYGVAIMILSILLRIILIPITIKQQKSMQKNSKIQGELKSLQVKYKNNPEELNKATMELYKREGISPFSGFLSGILQILIILAVFWLVSQPLTYMKRVQDSEIYKEYQTKIEQNTEGRSNYKEIAIINAVETDYNEIVRRLENKEYVEENAVIENNINSEENIIAEETQNIEENTETSENIEENVNNEENKKSEENVENNKEEDNLKTKEQLENRKNELEKLRLNMNFLSLDLSKVPTQSLNDWKVYIIPILYVITSFISIRLSTKTQNKKDGELSDQEASMQQMSKSMSFMMPIMSIAIAAIAPLGLALYWLISNILMIIERIAINKYFSSKEEDKNV